MAMVERHSKVVRFYGSDHVNLMSFILPVSSLYVHVVEQ